MNNVVIVGRLVRNPEIKQTDNSTDVLNITLAVDRNFKNTNGEYEVDFIDCILWKGFRVIIMYVDNQFQILKGFMLPQSLKF